MRRLLVLALLLCALPVGAQVNYYPATGGGSGDLLDPGSDGLLARTALGVTAARSITSSAGTIVVGNADGVAGNITLDVDTSIYGQFSSGTATVSGNCTLGDTYLETDTNLWSMCTSTNTWRTAVSFSETSTAGMGFVIDEDSFASDSATKVPTQQSVKAYVDANAGGTFDPSTDIIYINEFIGYTSSTQAGELGFGFTLIATGSVTTSASTPSLTTSHPGVWRLNSHVTNDDSGVLLRLDSGASSVPWGNPWETYDWTIEAVILPGSASTSIASVHLAFGLQDSVNTITSNNGAIRIIYDTDKSTATWVFQICDANADPGCDAVADDADSAIVASTKTPVAGTWARLRIRRQASGVGGNPTLYFSVGDSGSMEAEKTFCSTGCDDVLADAPTGLDLFPFFSMVTRTTTGVISSDIDYSFVKITGMTRY